MYKYLKVQHVPLALNEMALNILKQNFLLRVMDGG